MRGPGDPPDSEGRSEPGQVSASSGSPREELLEPVRRVFGWMLAQRNAAGHIVCPEHGIEHTGKNVGAITIACELARLDPKADRDELFEVARAVARRTVERLEREGDTTCFTFRPGRHDPYNCSNSVIDGGACSDALIDFVTTFGERLEPEERAACADAAVKHAQTYLRYCILDKGVPAQRAWAMTGVAQAFAYAGHEVLELAVSEGAGILEGIQHEDGSYPYHPLEWGAGHVGASDVSAFYQSRVSGFLMFALERIGRDPAHPLFREPIARGLDFLLGLQGPDGLKVGLVEAKPWYWGANHEVASHPFDAHALARGFHHFGHSRLAQGALRAFRAWAERITPEGRPRSHLPAPGRRDSYQCTMFWAGHTMWMARALQDLEHAACSSGAGGGAPGSPGDGGLEIIIQHFPSADVVRLEDGALCAWVRGARPGFNVHHGSPHGAGLVRAVRQTGEELLTRCRLSGRNEAEWSGSCGTTSLARGWRSGGAEVRFSLWLARNAWRRGRRLEAASTPLRLLRDGVLAFAGPRVGSAFHLTPQVRVLGDRALLEGGLARRDGTPLPDSHIRRSFGLLGDGLEVQEELVADGGARGLDYQVPAAAVEVEREEGRVRYVLR